MNIVVEGLALRPVRRKREPRHAIHDLERSILCMTINTSDYVRKRTGCGFRLPGLVLVYFDSLPKQQVLNVSHVGLKRK